MFYFIVAFFISITAGTASATFSGSLIVSSWTSTSITEGTTNSSTSSSGWQIEIYSGQNVNSCANNGALSDATFSNFYAMVYDSSGNLFVLENSGIRKITPAGNVSQFVGGCGNNPTGLDVDGTGTNAKFYSMNTGMTIDSSDNIYVISNGQRRVRKISPQGVSTTFFDIPAYPKSARGGIAVASDGSVYYTNWENNIMKIESDGGSESLLVGSSSNGSTDGSGTNASFNNPREIMFGPSGILYVSDGGEDNNGNTRYPKIRKVNVSTKAVTSFAGSTEGNLDGTGSSAKFSYPRGMTFDSNGNIYLMDNGNQKIRKITPSAEVSTLPLSNINSNPSIAIVSKEVNGVLNLYLGGYLYINRAYSGINPTVTLTNTDSDDIVSNSTVVTITATFSESMAATPTLSLTGIVSDAEMTATASASIWTYTWTVSTTVTSTTATVSGTDLSGNAYAGTDSLTFSIDNLGPTVVLSNNSLNNRVSNTQSVTLYATFSEELDITPTISLSGITTDAAMSNGNTIVLKPNNGWTSSSGSFQDFNGSSI